MANKFVSGSTDFDTQSAAIARKRKVLEAMTEQYKVGDGRMVGNSFIAPHWLEGVAQLGAAWKNRVGNKDLDTEESNLKKDYSAGLGEAVNNYFKTRDGSKETMEPTTLQDGTVLPSLEVRGEADPRRAVVDAMTSQYKPMQALGAAEFSTMGKQGAKMSEKEIYALADKYSPESVQQAAQAGDLSLLKPKKTYMAVNNNLVDTSGQAPTVAGDYGDKYGSVSQVGLGPDGKPIVGQVEARSGRVNPLGNTGTTVNVDTSEKKGKEKLSEAMATANVKQIQDSHEQAKKAQESFEIFKHAKDLLPYIKGGSWADVQLQARKAGNALHLTEDQSVAALEQVKAALQAQVSAKAHEFGTGNGFTDGDRKFVSEMVLSAPNLEPASLTRAVNLGYAGAFNTLTGHHALLRKAEARGGMDPDALNMFQVETPSVGHIPLGKGSDFEFDEKTNRLIVQGKSTSVSPGGSKWTSAHAEELARLKAELGVK